MGAENYGCTFGHLVGFGHKNRSPTGQRVHHMSVVHNLFPHIHRGTVEVERFLHRDDGAINSGAVTARCGQEDSFSRHAHIVRLHREGASLS